MCGGPLLTAMRNQRRTRRRSIALQVVPLCGHDLGLPVGKFGNNAELLTTGTSFSSGKTILLGNGGGTLASASGTTEAYRGAITGSGRLNIGDGINNGTNVLSGANNNTGGMLLNAGTLVANDAQALGLGDVVVYGGVLKTDLESITVKGKHGPKS